MIVPHGALSEALETYFLQGRDYTDNFSMLTSIVSRWMSGALRHSKPNCTGKRRREQFQFLAHSDTGGWVLASELADWFATELSTDIRLQRPNRMRIAWAVLRAACMDLAHNIDYRNARNAKGRANVKLRFQIACHCPSGVSMEDPHGSSLHRPS